MLSLAAARRAAQSTLNLASPRRAGVAPHAALKAFRFERGALVPSVIQPYAPLQNSARCRRSTRHHTTVPPPRAPNPGSLKSRTTSTAELVQRPPPTLRVRQRMAALYHLAPITLRFPIALRRRSRHKRRFRARHAAARCSGVCGTRTRRTVSRALLASFGRLLHASRSFPAFAAGTAISSTQIRIVRSRRGRMGSVYEGENTRITRPSRSRCCTPTSRRR